MAAIDPSGMPLSKEPQAHQPLAGKPTLWTTRATFYLSLMLNIAFIAFASWNGTFNRLFLRAGLTESPARTETQLSLERLYSNMPPLTFGTMFVGDSITFNAPYEFAFPSAYNRGIPGDTSVDILARMKDLLRNRPKNVVLQVGINDLLHGARVENVAKNVVSAALQFAKYSHVFIVSVFPINSRLSLSVPNKNSAIDELDSEISRLIVGVEQLTRCNLKSILVDQDGLLRAEYSLEGLHLSAAGYHAVLPVIEDIVIEKSSQINTAIGISSKFCL